MSRFWYGLVLVGTLLIVLAVLAYVTVAWTTPNIPNPAPSWGTPTW